MTQRKERVTITVDKALVRAANDAVRAGRAQSLSGWVSAAMEEHAAKERRLIALAAAVSEYESRHGQITMAEIDEQERLDRRKARVVRRRATTRRPGAA
jgi:hypothetical protein